MNQKKTGAKKMKRERDDEMGSETSTHKKSRQTTTDSTLLYEIPNTFSFSVKTRLTENDEWADSTLFRIPRKCTNEEEHFIMLAKVDHLFKLCPSNESDGDQVYDVQVDGKPVLSFKRGASASSPLILARAGVRLGLRGFKPAPDVVLPFCFAKNHVASRYQEVTPDLDQIGVIKVQVLSVVGNIQHLNANAEKIEMGIGRVPHAVPEEQSKQKGVSTSTKGVERSEMTKGYQPTDLPQPVKTVEVNYLDKLAFSVAVNMEGLSVNSLLPHERQYLWSEYQPVQEPKQEPAETSTSFVDIDLNRVDTPSPTPDTDSCYTSEVNQLTPNSRSVSDWTTADVIPFLTSIDPQYCMYAKSFVDNGIDGNALIALNNELLKDLGVSMVGHRARILKAIQEIHVEVLDME